MLNEERSRSLEEIRLLLASDPVRLPTCDDRFALSRHTPDYLAKHGCIVRQCGGYCFWCEPIYPDELLDEYLIVGELTDIYAVVADDPLGDLC